jgi:hypothetical protein
MAVVGILSTQLLDYLFLRNFPPSPVKEPDNVKIVGDKASSATAREA